MKEAIEQPSEAILDLETLNVELLLLREDVEETEKEIEAAESKLERQKKKIGEFHDGLIIRINEGATTGDPFKDQTISGFGFNSRGYNNFLHIAQEIEKCDEQPIFILEGIGTSDRGGRRRYMAPGSHVHSSAIIPPPDPEVNDYMLYFGTLSGEKPEIVLFEDNEKFPQVTIPTIDGHFRLKVSESSIGKLEVVVKNLSESEKRGCLSPWSWWRWIDSMEDTQKLFCSGGTRNRFIRFFIGNDEIEKISGSKNLYGLNVIQFLLFLQRNFVYKLEGSGMEEEEALSMKRAIDFLLNYKKNPSPEDAPEFGVEI